MKEVVGQRKVILTKWMLIIFSFGTVGYMFLSVYHGQHLPDSFFLNFVMGLGAIGGAFTMGNIFEHRAKADAKKAEMNMQHNQDGSMPAIDNNDYRS